MEYPTPGEGGTSKFFTSKWAQKMNEQLPRSLRSHWFVFWGDQENLLGGSNHSPWGGQGLTSEY